MSLNIESCKVCVFLGKCDCLVYGVCSKDNRSGRKTMEFDIEDEQNGIIDELPLTEQDIDEIEDMEMELYNEVVLDDLNQGGMV